MTNFQDYRAEVTGNTGNSVRVYILSVCSPSREAALMAVKHQMKSKRNVIHIHSIKLTAI